MKLRKLITLVLVAAIVFGTAWPVHALWLIAPCSQGGVWPKNWPKELEPLRKQSRQLVFGGVSRPDAPITHNCSRFEIPFTAREQFESAWPHILTLKNKGAPLTLLPVADVRVQTGNTVRTEKTSGVRILVSMPITPVDPKAADRLLRAINDPKVLGPAVPPKYVTGIELVVDGEIVDLNRIRLPANTPIIDKRFAD
jgi:hypothetical protein